MTEDTRNVRDAFASVDTSSVRVGTDPGDLPLLDRARYEAIISDLSDSNAELAASLRLYEHAAPSPDATFLAFVAGAVTTLISCAIMAAVVLFVSRNV